MFFFYLLVLHLVAGFLLLFTCIFFLNFQFISFRLLVHLSLCFSLFGFFFFLFFSFHIFGMWFLFVCYNTHQTDKNSHEKNADHQKLWLILSQLMNTHTFKLTITHTHTLYSLNGDGNFGFIFVSNKKYQHQNFLFWPNESTLLLIEWYVFMFYSIRNSNPFKCLFHNENIRCGLLSYMYFSHKVTGLFTFLNSFTFNRYINTQQTHSHTCSRSHKKQFTFQTICTFQTTNTLITMAPFHKTQTPLSPTEIRIPYVYSLWILNTEVLVLRCIGIYYILQFYYDLAVPTSIKIRFWNNFWISIIANTWTLIKWNSLS